MCLTVWTASSRLDSSVRLVYLMYFDLLKILLIQIIDFITLTMAPDFILFGLLFFLRYPLALVLDTIHFLVDTLHIRLQLVNQDHLLAGLFEIFHIYHLLVLLLVNTDIDVYVHILFLRKILWIHLLRPDNLLFYFLLRLFMFLLFKLPALWKLSRLFLCGWLAFLN